MNNFLEKHSDHYILFDHANGFNKQLKNQFLENIAGTVYTEYMVNDVIKQNYPKIKFKYNLDWRHNFVNNINLDTCPDKKFKNFVCSFNGSDSVSRQFLTSAMYKFKWINADYFSKNFCYSKDKIDGNILEFFNDPKQESFYRKFIIDDSPDVDAFYHSVISIDYDQFNHTKNLQTLSGRISESFVQLIAETEGTSYFPFITEKFIYPIANKTLFIMFGQPGWNQQVEEYYGFKKYNQIFNYEFDNIQNPVIRLVEIMAMISKFEKLSKFDWHDLYLLEYETIEYNYDWFRSKKYLEKLKRCTNVVD